MTQKRKIHLGYVLFFIFTVLTTIVLAYRISPPQTFSEPPEYVNATRIELIGPHKAKAGTEVVILVRAVDDFGRVDKQRTDEIKLIITPPQPSVKLSADKVVLSNGEAVVTLFVREPTKVTISADWVRGPSWLRPSSIVIEFE